MKLRFQLLALAGFAFFASCGNSSDNKTGEDTTVTSTTTTTTDNTSVANIEVPVTTKTSFETKYPQASSVRWGYHRPDMSFIEWDWSGWPVVDTSDYIANFSWEGNDYWAWYDANGEWIGTVNRISDPTTLPAAVNTAIKAQYKDYTVISVDRENDKNRTAYEIQLESGADKLKVLVDENGKIMKKKVISGDSKTKDNTTDKDTTGK
jgi:hypothetical protein